MDQQLKYSTSFSVYKNGKWIELCGTMGRAWPHQFEKQFEAMLQKNKKNVLDFYKIPC